MGGSCLLGEKLLLQQRMHNHTSTTRPPVTAMEPVPCARPCSRHAVCTVSFDLTTPYGEWLSLSPLSREGM